MTGDSSRTPRAGAGRPARRGRRKGGGSNEAVRRIATLERLMAEQVERNLEGRTVLMEAVERLDKSLIRVGHEQFKANALVEAAQKDAQVVIGQLREASASQEREIAQLRDRIAEAGNHARLDIVRRILPVLDVVEEMLAAGRRPEERTADGDRSRWHRFDRRGQTAAADGPDGRPTAWMEGLESVRDRLLEALASAGVTPMKTDGCAFDPRLHVAVESIAASNGARPGMVVEERRRGYMLGDSSLRLAQVIVAKERVDSRK
jgi:molecular chaperone GrpE (heat shock protein)